MGQSCTGRSLCLLPCCVAFSFLLGSVSSAWDFGFSDEVTGTPGNMEPPEHSHPNSGLHLLDDLVDYGVRSASHHVHSSCPSSSATACGMLDNASHCVCEADENGGISTEHWKSSCLCELLEEDLCLLNGVPLRCWRACVVGGSSKSPPLCDEDTTGAGRVPVVGAENASLKPKS